MSAWTRLGVTLPWVVAAAALALAAAFLDPESLGSIRRTRAEEHRPEPANTVTDEARGAIASMLSAYDRVGTALSADRIGLGASEAQDLERDATSAAALVPDGMRRKLRRIARSAGVLALTPVVDAAAFRRTFGEVSRAVVVFLASNRTLVGDLRIFECPIAPGYRKWAQTAAEIRNPYLGARRRDCGVASEWRE